ncbi:hypothetical protein Ae201684P_013458 [Aphanomyces euteiches]|uniref:Uncharacterized protein n=1 Tax=Aphanomyces euteiches TaxID=100861 RepID=A0A6G0WDE7_9STRA|nr:hypothetical protein Ae201684_016254 [Aphanomyces euteiches]KAH9095343.1 hypothetical protein Ae201684P_013458 [Aphanomyces euteiches]KAH9151467.1 hypothetical protein AeRB84_005920 [Aphanomyces euteiches]
MEAAALTFRVLRATGSSFEHPVANLTTYSRKSYWASFAKPKEVVVLAIDTKALLGEVRIFNKNAHAVDIDVAVDDKLEEYVKVKTIVRLPLNREFRIKLGYLPTCFVRLTFHRQSQNYIAVYGIQPIGIPWGVLEQGGGPSLFHVVSSTTEKLLFGPSLPASLPRRDCLSDTISGSPAWMQRHKSLLETHITRLENSLAEFTQDPPHRASSWMY